MYNNATRTPSANTIDAFLVYRVPNPCDNRDPAGKPFDAVSASGSIRCMIVASPDKEWLTVAEAAELAGCSEGWIRLKLAAGELEGWKSGERAWNVAVDSVLELRKTLSPRSLGQRDAKPAKPAKPKRRKSR